MGKNTRVASDYAVRRTERHQRDETLSSRSIGLRISHNPVVFVRCDWRLTVTLVDSAHSVSSTEGEHSGEAGPYTAGIVQHSLTVAVESCTRFEGFVDIFGSEDAG